MKKVSEPFGKGIWQLLFIVNPTVQSTFMRMNATIKSIAGFDTHNGSKAKDALVHFTCGGMAGITLAYASYHLDIVRTRLAAHFRNKQFVIRSCYGGQMMKDSYQAYMEEERQVKLLNYLSQMLLNILGFKRKWIRDSLLTQRSNRSHLRIW